MINISNGLYYVNMLQVIIGVVLKTTILSMSTIIILFIYIFLHRTVIYLFLKKIIPTDQ